MSLSQLQRTALTMALQKCPSDESVASNKLHTVGLLVNVVLFLRSRRMCAATVDTPEPDTKWTQQPDCVAKHEMMRTHTVTSPTDLRKDSTAKGCGVADGGREGRMPKPLF